MRITAGSGPGAMFSNVTRGRTGGKLTSTSPRLRRMQLTTTFATFFGLDHPTSHRAFNASIPPPSYIPPTVTPPPVGHAPRAHNRETDGRPVLLGTQRTRQADQPVFARAVRRLER